MDFKFGNEHRTLTDQKLARFKEAYKNLRVLIIDEISLLGADMLYKIHLRLNEIRNLPEAKPFAGISVILVGDLLQLAPVKAKYIFDAPLNQQFRPYHDVAPLWQSFDPMVLSHNHRQGMLTNYSYDTILTMIILQVMQKNGPIL